MTKKGPWLECPHCSEKRQGMSSMEEHIEARHQGTVKVQGATQVIPGTDEVPDELVQQIDAMVGQFAGLPDPVRKEAGIEIAMSFENGAMWRGKKMPEYVTLWSPTCVPVKVHSKRIWKVIFGKGFRPRPPTPDEYNRFWFHYTCPIPTCKLNRQWCEWHQSFGKDSNHELRSPEYMMLDHLRTGGKVHKQYYEFHKEELAVKYRDAFRAYESALAQREDDMRKRMEAA